MPTRAAAASPVPHIRIAAAARCGSLNTPQATEIKALKTAISIQHEELDRILEIKEHLEASTQFFTEQINEKDKLIKRLIDRLDQKDEIIQQFINDMKRKDIIIDKLMEKCM